jgi:hypothetical protein
MCDDDYSTTWEPKFDVLTGFLWFPAGKVSVTISPDCEAAERERNS